MRCKILIAMLLWSVLAAAEQPQHMQQPNEQPSPQHPANWARLKVWTNEYPLSKKRSIFKDAELHRALLSLLGDSDYKRMMKDFELAIPIQVIGGYLVIQGSVYRSFPFQEVFILLGLNDASIRVAFIANNAVEWHSTSQNVETTLPGCILFQIYAALD
jgi:hypothetical protein